MAKYFSFFWAVFIFIHFNGVSFINAHVGLTFPPARKYDLDFLDNVRSRAPCGMPKGKSRTQLMAGSSVNITWHLAYPHRGGYKLELFDPKEKYLMDLTPKENNEEYVLGDATAQWHSVALPKDTVCKDCTIRLVRTAKEWSGNYRFWSCADVDIVAKDEYKRTCSGHGQLDSSTGLCSCHKRYWGPDCAYEDECDDDDDCGGTSKGQCVDLHGTAHPRKQCFCAPGYHGQNCASKNKDKLADSKSINLTNHKKNVLSDRFSLYYKVLPASQEDDKEIEFVLVINGTSYGALGWRSSDTEAECKQWPYISDNESRNRRETKRKQTASAVAEPESEPEFEPTKGKSDSHAEPESEPGNRRSANAEPKGEPESSNKKNYKSKKPVPEPESSAETTSRKGIQAEPEPESEPTTEPEPESEATTIGGKVSSEPQSAKNKNRKSNAEPEPETSNHEPVSEPKPERHPSSEPEPESGKNKGHSNAEPEPESGKIKGHSNAEPEPESGKNKGHSNAEPEPESGKNKGHSNAEPEPESGKNKDHANAEPEPESGKNKDHANAEAEPEAESTKKGHASPESEPTVLNKRQSEIKPKSELKVNKQSKPEPSAEAEPTAISEPEAEAEPTTSKHKHSSTVIPEPEKEPQSEPEAEAEPSTKGHSKNKHHPEPESEPETNKSKIKIKSKYTEKNKGSVAEPHAEAESEPEPESSKKPEKYKYKPGGSKKTTNSRLEAEHESESEPKAPQRYFRENESLLRPVRKSEKNRQRIRSKALEQSSGEAYNISSTDEGVTTTGPEASERKEAQTIRKLKESPYTPKGDFHSMDCTDIILGSARGSYSRIRDYYTRDRSTPRLDSFYGGTDDILSATGWEMDGQTTLIFRRKLSSKDPADHSFSGEMHVIWARGQESGEYVHKPSSGLEKENATNPEFYTKDEIKYHGHRGQRGVTFINFSK